MSAANKIAAIAAEKRVAALVAAIPELRSELLDLAVEVQQIAAPTFDEGKRAQFAYDYLTNVGLADVSVDEIGNVFGRIPGSDPAQMPTIVSAHSDTVFPLETDLAVRRKGEKIHGPGIADNSTGMAGVLTLAKWLCLHEIQAAADIWIVVNVGEEGLGDLNGMRKVVERLGKANYVVVEGGMFGCILHEAIAVRRYEITVTTAGGHSWSDFGRPSAVHAIGRLIAAFDNIPVPASPKTTYNVGVISGGTSINTIASSASLLLDLRSEVRSGVEQLQAQADSLIREISAQTGTKIEARKIGDRPAGRIPGDWPLVKQAVAALKHTGLKRIQRVSGSTDANIPLEAEYPAVCIGLAHSQNAHRTDEWMEITQLNRGMEQLLLLTLAAAKYEAA